MARRKKSGPAEDLIELVTMLPWWAVVALEQLVGGGMLRRTAKRGANAGGEFWGCTGYPVCRSTRPIA